MMNSRQEPKHLHSGPFKTVIKNNNNNDSYTVDQQPRVKSLTQELIEHPETMKDRDNSKAAFKRNKSYLALQ